MHDVPNADTSLCSSRARRLSRKYGLMCANTACKIPTINAWSVVTTRCELYSSRIRFICLPWTSYSGKICTPRTNKEYLINVQTSYFSRLDSSTGAALVIGGRFDTRGLDYRLRRGWRRDAWENGLGLMQGTSYPFIFNYGKTERSERGACYHLSLCSF